ncbi:hypothetical protein JYQ78_03930, partial [Anaerobutyricum hallii]|uniref:hypothetical protein n=1 Tax=Anaerobutyricum hallii TaxID=39488 RepID=UPI001ADDE328
EITEQDFKEKLSENMIEYSELDIKNLFSALKKFGVIKQDGHIKYTLSKNLNQEYIDITKNIFEIFRKFKNEMKKVFDSKNTLFYFDKRELMDFISESISESEKYSFEVNLDDKEILKE